MNLTLPLVCAIAGVVFLVIGITEEKINILDKIKIPKISIRMRNFPLVIGIVFLIIGIWLKNVDSKVGSKDNKSPSPIKLIEAENCYTNGTEDCHTSGRWQVWPLAEFSNGQSINNEDPDHMGQASDSSSFYLNFEGTGVITIVYRQDTWYGSLDVEIDKKVVGSINQKGPIKNQIEKTFKVGSKGKHSLVLHGSKAAGVITIDAIKISR